MPAYPVYELFYLAIRSSELCLLGQQLIRLRKMFLKTTYKQLSMYINSDC